MENTKIITINEVEYDYYDLPREAKALYEQIILLDRELKRLEPVRVRREDALARLTELLKPVEEEEEPEPFNIS